MEAETKAGFSTVSSQNTVAESANEVRHQTVLARLDHHTERDDLNSEKMAEVFQHQVKSMDKNESGFQDVHTGQMTASSSNLECHNTTHALLGQCGGWLQQIIRNHVMFGSPEDSVPTSVPRAKASSKAIVETAVFWKYSVYRMPIGVLKIHLRKTWQSRKPSRSTSQVCTGSDIALEFVPPWWLSRMAIRYSMKLSSDLLSNQLRLGATLDTLTVNYNPLFVKALKSGDVNGVRRSFEEGLARPTDYLLNESFGILEPWYMVCFFKRIRDVVNSSYSLSFFHLKEAFMHYV